MTASAQYSTISRLESAKLAELRDELEQDLRRLTMIAGFSENGTSFLDASSQARSRVILSALARMEDGTYGTCLACRGPIPYVRLAAIPEATTCMGCTAGARAGSRRSRSAAS